MKQILLFVIMALIGISQTNAQTLRPYRISEYHVWLKTIPGQFKTKGLLSKAGESSLFIQNSRYDARLQEFKHNDIRNLAFRNRKSILQGMSLGAVA